MTSSTQSQASIGCDCCVIMAAQVTRVTPVIEVLPDGSFVSTTYCVMAPTESPLVVSLRFDLDEIDQRATNLDG